MYKRHIKTALKLPKLDVRYNPTTSATRIPLLANGTIDLECGNTTNNLERHKLVSFAPTTVSYTHLNIPTTITTVETDGFSGNTYPELLAVFPDNKILELSLIHI